MVMKCTTCQESCWVFYHYLISFLPQLFEADTTIISVLWGKSISFRHIRWHVNKKISLVLTQAVCTQDHPFNHHIHHFKFTLLVKECTYELEQLAYHLKEWSWILTSHMTVKQASEELNKNNLPMKKYQRTINIHIIFGKEKYF